jgi:uncharacterized protein (TIGR03437 family)
MASLTFCSLMAQTTPVGRLDFLKSKDPSFALFANTSNSNTGLPYPNDLVLLTGLPFNLAISARVGLLGPVRVCRQCGGLRSVVISPDGDTALVSTEPTSANQVNATRSALFVLRNLRAFLRTRNPDDLQIRTFSGTDYPALDNVAGLAFGPDGRWAVVNSVSPAYDDLTYTALSGRVTVITGLPENPKFSAPIPVPTHSIGNIDLSLDGETLLLNDVNDFTDGGFKSDQILVQGIHPGGPPARVAAIARTSLAEVFKGGPPTVNDARLTLDGRFVIAPIAAIRSLNSNQQPNPVNQIAILGPVRNGRLDTARLLTEADGVKGGPYQAGVSPDGDSALIGNALDNGGANLITGLGFGDPAQVKVEPLPLAFFGPPFPQGPNGPPVLAPHGQPMYTPDGDSALVVNFISPPLVGAKLSPSLSVLTGFQKGDIKLAANLSDSTLNPYANHQQIATAPPGLMDYVNLYVPAGWVRNGLVSDLNQLIADADQGNSDDAVVGQLASFIGNVNDIRGLFSRSQANVMGGLAVAGIQALIGGAENVSAAGLNPGSVSPDSIASLLGAGITASTLPSLANTFVTIIDSNGMERPASVFGVSPGRIDYLVPAGVSSGKGIAFVSAGNQMVAAATVSIEAISPGLFTLPGGNIAAAYLQRVKENGTQSIEPITDPINLAPATDKVFLVLFGTGIRGRDRRQPVSVRVGGQEVEVTFSGPQGSVAGLDQVNVALPRSLAGLGRVDIALSIDGWDANIVQAIVR